MLQFLRAGVDRTAELYLTKTARFLFYCQCFVNFVVECFGFVVDKVIHTLPDRLLACHNGSGLG